MRLVTLSGGSRQSSSQPNGSFPDRAQVQLEYVKTVRTSPGVVTSTDEVFHMNSLFDPDITLAGHQPRDFDTWSTVYGKYRVFKARYELSLRQRASHGISATIVPNTVVAALTAAGFPAELPRAKYLGVTGSNQPVLHASGEFLCSAILGQSPAQYAANENTAALVTANPTESLYIHLFVQQLDATTVADFEYELRLTFFAEMFDRQVLGPSALIARLRELGGFHDPPPHPDDDDVVGPDDLSEVPRIRYSRPPAVTPPGGVTRAFPPLATSCQVQAAAASAARGVRR